MFMRHRIYPMSHKHDRFEKIRARWTASIHFRPCDASKVSMALLCHHLGHADKFAIDMKSHRADNPLQFEAFHRLWAHLLNLNLIPLSSPAGLCWFCRTAQVLDQARPARLFQSVLSKRSADEGASARSSGAAAKASCIEGARHWRIGLGAFPSFLFRWRAFLAAAATSARAGERAGADTRGRQQFERDQGKLRAPP